MIKTVAIIPARGGSKGIPRKNLYPFNGKPLIVWCIESALHADLVDRVAVSTDDAEIASIAKAAGAEVVMRPDKISNDMASSEDALLHALENLEREPELLVFLQCTSPLTASEDINNCIRKLIECSADSAFSATESHRFLWKNTGDAKGINHDGAERKRRQDLETEYEENGAIYVMRTAGFIKARHRFFGKTVISEMPVSRSWEIDSPEDILVAEALAHAMQPSSLLPHRIDAVVFDFDGVMTDNTVYISEEGVESVRCNRSDGWGIARLRETGIHMAVMSTEKNEVVSIRCKKLGIECFYDLGSNKFECFAKWCKKHDLIKENVVYVGNDANDLDCLTAAGSGIVPADAHESAKKIANVVLSTNGGQGAVREVCDMILKRIKH